MTTMIEKVARAICNEQPYDDLPEIATYRERKTHVHRAMLDKQEAREVARAAIEAMLEPTPAILKAMEDMPADGHDWEFVREDGPDYWRSMIDAALNETDA